MKKYFIITILFVGILPLFHSCTLPNGISIGNVGEDGEYINIHFDNISLNYDFSNKLYTEYIAVDYNEFLTAHPSVYNADFSGTIDNLASILINEENYKGSNKPSIKVIFDDLVEGQIEHQCKKEDIAWNAVFGIPNPNNLYKGTVEIKSIKTNNYGIQVVWKRVEMKDNWPIEEIVEKGVISCDVSHIVKAGTNNSNGNVAGRGDKVISNTSDVERIDDMQFVIEEEVYCVSPDLYEPVLVGGEISDSVKWDEPTIYKAI